jgi:TonB-dependent receptor
MIKKRLLLATAIILANHQWAYAQDEEPSQEEELASEEPSEPPPTNGAIEEIVTLGKFIPNEKRATASVANLLDADALTTAGDSNIAEGLKRVSGLNLSDGKFIYIRGLGERYSAAMVNGATLPSPEPITRAVPVDLFPSSIIDSVLVQKTFSAAFPAEFAGGMIQMRTKVVPNEPFFELSSSIGYNDNTTSKGGLTYEGASRDWKGVDKGTRDQSNLLKLAIAGDRELRVNNAFYDKGFSEDELEAIGESLPSVYTPVEKDIQPDVGVNANFGTVKDIGDGDVRVGILSNLSYSNSWESLTTSRNSYSSSNSGTLGVASAQSFRSTQQNADSSMFWNAGLEIRDEHSLNFTVLQVNKMDDLAGITTGLLGSEGVDIRQMRLEWIEQNLLTQQLQGNHIFFGYEDFEIDWHYNESRAKREAPDMRQFRYDLEEQSGEYLFCLRAVCNQRVWSDLEDNITDFGLTATLYADTPFDSYTTLKAGVSRIRKDRESDLRRFSYISQGGLSSNRSLRLNPRLEGVINASTIEPTGFQIKESTQTTDNYRATQELDAYFAEADIEFSSTFRLMAGVRQEESIQEVTTFDLFNANTLVKGDLADDNVYPTVTGTWILEDLGMQLRLGYSETTSRPDFRELSTAPFIHPVTGLEIIGNPDLTVAFIDNYDARWEWYFSASESVSIGIFHKEFTNPIEAIMQPGIDNRRTFINAEAGEVQGIEFDAYHWLGFIDESLESWFTAANLTLLDSEVVIKPEDAGILTESTRRLQGQADHIYNVQLGYDDTLTHKGSLVYHVTGERIREAGVLGAPDVLDQPYGELDFNYIYTMSDHLSFNVKAKNLLKQKRESTQGNLDANSWYEGRNYNLSMTYTF